MKNRKQVIYFDMDGVLANFIKGVGRDVPLTEKPQEMYEEGFYRNLPVMEGAKEAIEALLNNSKFEVYVASKPAKHSEYCASEKYEWIKEHFPRLYKKIVLICDKSLLRGHYLVDDNPEKWEGFEGLVIGFNPREGATEWERVTNLLLN